MWLACALIILFSVGFVVPVMLDITMTPDSEFTVLSKGMWLMIAGAFWIFGAAAWLLIGRPQRPQLLHRSGRYADGLGPAQALLRHPAAQAAGGYGDPGDTGNWMAGLIGQSPVGPDDDEEFMEELDRRIRETREDD
jgi:hypothetical protein